MKLYFDDTTFDGQLQRTAAKASYAACDLGEMFAVASRITPGDYDSWYREWFAAGESNRELADVEAAKGHTESARQAYLRASEYYRSAYFFSRRDPEGGALLAAYRAARDTFRAAVPHLPFPTEHVQIPYDGVRLDGYVITPPSGPSDKVLLWPAGYDSPVEEAYGLGAAEAAARGITVLAFEGPGQGGALYELELPFRHDFEVVTSAVLDFVESRTDLSGARVGMVGRSFGGYLAPRAASKEPRLAAIAADPAQSDMGAAFHKMFPPDWAPLLEKGDPAFNDEVWKAFPGVAGQEWWLSRAKSHGLSTPLAYVQEMAKWVVDVAAITCPTFVSYGEGDFAQVMTKDFYDRLTVSEKQFVMYREADGAGGHCEGMGPSRYFADVLGWFEDRLR